MSKAKQFSILLVIVFLVSVAGRGGGILPPSTPPPLTDKGLRVAVWYESADKLSLPAGQKAIIDSQVWRQWVEDHGGDWCCLDPTDKPIHAAAWIQEAWGRHRDSLPWFVCGNGTTGSEGPLPATEADFMGVLTPLGE